MSILNQREYDIGQVESQIRIRGWYQEWLELLLAGRDPTQSLANASQEQIQGLGEAAPPQILPTEET